MSYLAYNAPPTVYHIVAELTYCCRAGAAIFGNLLEYLFYFILHMRAALELICGQVLTVS